MKHIQNTIFLILVSISTLIAPDQVSNTIPMPLTTETSQEETKNTPESLTKSAIEKNEDKKNYISFRYNQAPLLDIITELAEKKGYNIVIPAGQQSITEKISIQLPQKISINDAWERILTFLKICGYSVIFHKEFVSIIKSETKEFIRNPFPLYVHTDDTQIPNSDEKIRYVYYFHNLQVANDPTTNGAIADILLSVLSKDTGVYVDETINAIIITDTARHIAAAVKLLQELDRKLFKNEGKEIINLKHTTATQVAAYMQTLINPTGKQTVSDIGSPSQSHYFSKGLRIIAEPRTNALIVLGKKDALQRVKLFIEEFIDIPLDSGDSILHIYDLQYLDAVTFKQTLHSILTSQSSTSQSSGTNHGTSAGEQYFKDVKIIAESTESVNPATLGSSSAGKQSGNRLIIAAKHDDWLRIEKLIRDLDKPQLQVAIEVLIVDLTIEENKTLGAQLRNLADLSIGSANFQTSHLGGNADGVFIEQDATSSTQANLLQSNLLQSTGSDSLGNQINIASAMTAGSFVLSFNDPATNGMWLITQVLKSYQDVKILSQPFITALNNQACSFKLDETRLLAGGSNVIPGGGGVQTYKEAVTARLAVNITPNISRDARITLAINIEITEYQSTNSTVILNRDIQTNVNIKDGDILVLGGLTKTQIAKTETSTPLLGSIPIIGNLFKKRSDIKTKENLLVFLSPRIINLRKEGKLDPYTAIKISKLNNYFETQAKEKDPITHWFFGSIDDEIEVKRLKMWGRKNIFEPESEQQDTKVIFVAKDEKLPEDSIKKVGPLLPSPDKKAAEKTSSSAKPLKTETGMTHIKIPPIEAKVVKVPDLVVEALTRTTEELTPEKSDSPDKNKQSQEPSHITTATGMKRIIIEHPTEKVDTKQKDTSPKMSSIIEKNKEQKHTNKSTKQEAELRDLVSQLKPLL